MRPIIIPLKPFVLFIQICHPIAAGDECHNERLGFFSSAQEAYQNADLREEFIRDTRETGRVGPARVTRTELFKP